MKFIIEKKALTRLLRVLGSDPKKKAHPALLRLAAHDGQIILQAHDTEAGCEALILEEGVCFFRSDQFLPLVRTYAGAKSLTIEATPDGLQIGTTKISREFWEISLFQNPRTAPETLTFGSTEGSDVPHDAQTGPRLSAPPDPPAPPELAPRHRASDTTRDAFPIAEDELHLVEEVIRHTRRFCALPKVTPPQLAGLARALFALERLPRISKGVEVEFNVGIRWGRPDDCREQWVTFRVSDSSFGVGTMSVTSDPAVGSDHHTTAVYEVDNGGYRSMEAGDENVWMQIFDWINHVDGLLDQNLPEDVMLFVEDSSEPDCMKTSDAE